MRVPGVSAYCHHAAAALAVDGAIAAAGHIDVLTVGNCFLSKADRPVAFATRCAAGPSLD